MSIQLTYGLKDGKVVRVTDANVANGLECNCTCLDCKARLVAVANRKGCSVRPHFRHHSSTNSGENIACTESQETAIHYLAKEIIEKNKWVTLPPYIVRVNKHNGHGTREHPIRESQIIKFDFVINENSISTSQGFQKIRPDLIAYYKEYRLFIEIAVSNSCKNTKIEKIKELNISAIEIDLSNFDRTASEEELEKYLQEKAPIKWIYHVKEDKYRQIALKKEQEKAEWAAIYAEKAKQEKKDRELKQKKEEIRKLRMKFPSYFEDIILNNNYRGNLLSRADKFIQSEYGKSINCDFKGSNIPYIEHEIEGLNDIYIFSNGYDNNGYENYGIECEFMELPFNFSITLEHSNYKAGFFIIANIYYQAAKLLCNNLENEVFKQEIELEKLAKKAEERRKAREHEWEEERKKKVLENEERQKIAEQYRRDEEELRKRRIEERKKQEADRKCYEEKLVFETVMMIRDIKIKQERWKKEHPVTPKEVISKIKNQIPDFGEQRFIEIRRTLQNKKIFLSVEEYKLLTATIIK